MGEVGRSIKSKSWFLAFSMHSNEDVELGFSEE
jgi:hypothetical protein